MSGQIKTIQEFILHKDEGLTREIVLNALGQNEKWRLDTKEEYWLELNETEYENTKKYFYTWII